MPRRTTRVLNDSTLRTEKPGDIPKDLSDAQQPGLIFTVFPSGRRQFSVRYRVQGKQRRLVLGDYGPRALTLSKARERAAAELVKIREGVDRALELRAVKERPTDTVGALADRSLHPLRQFDRCGAECHPEAIVLRRPALEMFSEFRPPSPLG